MATIRPPQIVIIGTVLAVLVALGYWLTAEPTPERVVDRAHQEEAAQDAREAQARVEAAKQREALAGTKRQAAIQSATDTLALLDTLQAETARLTAEVTPLLTNERGRLLTGRDAWLERFFDLYQQSRPTPAEATVVRARLGELRARLEASSATTEPDAAVVQQLADDRTWAEQAIAAYRTPHDAIVALLAGAEAANVPPTSASLQDALTALRARKELAAADAFKAQQEHFRADETQAELARRDAEHQRKMAADAEVAAQAAKDQEAAAAQAASDQAAAAARELEAARLAALRKKAEDPAVQKEYAVILTPGRYVLGTSPPRYLDVKTPYSYSFLVNGGVTRNVQTFISLGVDAYNWNDRPKWARPTTQEQLDKFQQMMADFEQLGPIWVEMKLLNP